jgi:hypothetical protein
VNGTAADTAGGSWAASSDQRLKTNVASISGADALAKINELNPITFDWVNPGVHGNQQAPGGFLAQQIAQVFPEFVSATTCQGLDCALVGGADSSEYTIQLPFKFDAYLVAGIQALYAKIQPFTAVLSVVPGVDSQCVTGDTRLRRRKKKNGEAQSDGNFGTEYDEIEIKNIAVGDEIQSLDELTGKVVYSRVNALIDMGEQEVFELKTASGRTIRTTANHPYLARIASKEA